MIIEYQRPTSVSEALILLSRKQPLSYPIGGGTVISRGEDEQIAVVDLQALGLGSISKKGNYLRIGATVTLQRLLEYKGLMEEFYKTIELETTYNLRQMATVAGRLVTANGRSPFTTAMLALDVSLEIHEQDVEPRQVRIGDWLPIRESFSPGKLITNVSVPVNIKFTYEYIARTPADLPIICAAVAQWDSGRTRLALGGWGSCSILVMDGPNADGIEFGAKSAAMGAQDEWASREYRQEMASLLALRCLKRIQTQR
jgi:CO/xanthine dehydrogenase FAD-binding subunit